MPFDLSKVMFITTANDYGAIPAPLLDRMDVITLGSYTHEEKYQIATRHLLPKQLRKNGIPSRSLKVVPAAMHELIDSYTSEMPAFETWSASWLRSARKYCKNNLGKPGSENKRHYEKLEDLLGPKRFKLDRLAKTDEVGLVNGLAWTSVGGEILPVRPSWKVQGKIELTGSLGDVMKESARTAITCIRTRAAKLSISHDFYCKYDIHIHAPEGPFQRTAPRRAFHGYRHHLGPV